MTPIDVIDTFRVFLDHTPTNSLPRSMRRWLISHGADESALVLGNSERFTLYTGYGERFIVTVARVER